MELLDPIGQYCLGYREVIPSQTLPEKWKELTLNIGGTQGTLQDIELPERSGGYYYKNQDSPTTRNRFIYWRLQNDVLELSEQSLDINLHGNNIRFRFENTPVLEGISVWEVGCKVVILVPTVSSVHYLKFPHPNANSYDEYMVNYHPDFTVKSIFSDVLLSDARDPVSFHIINNTMSNCILPHTATTLLIEENAIFALAYSSGSITLVHMELGNGVVNVRELKQDANIPKFLIGLAGMISGKNIHNETVVSMAFHSFATAIYLFCLHQDGRLRVWDCSQGHCLKTVDLIANKTVDGQRPVNGVQHHAIRKAVQECDDVLTLAIHLSYANLSEICVIKVSECPKGLKLAVKHNIRTLYPDLIDFTIDKRKIWAVWRSSDGSVAVSNIFIDENSRDWQFSHLEKLPSLEEQVGNGVDIAGKCLSSIFYPGRFPLSVISKAIMIFQRNTVISSVTLSAGKLKQLVIHAIEAEIEKDPLNRELNDIDRLDLIYDAWSKFYSCCVQYYEAYMRPIGIFMLGESGAVLVKKQQFSILRPMDTLEYFLISQSKDIYNQEFVENQDVGNEANVKDLVKLMVLVSMIDQKLSDDLRQSFKDELLQHRNPDEAIVSILIELIDKDGGWGSDILVSFAKVLSEIENVYDTLAFLIDILICKNSDNARPNVQLNPSYKLIFSSKLAHSLMSASLLQFSYARFTICQNLLLILHLLLDHPQNINHYLKYEEVMGVRSHLLPQTVVMLHSYFVVLWVCQTSTYIDTVPPSRFSIQQNLRNDYDHYSTKILSHTAQQKTVIVVEEFFQWCNTPGVRHQLKASNIPLEYLPVWHYSMVGFIKLLCRFVSPIFYNFELAEFLLCCRQYGIVQRYLRLVDTWCSPAKAPCKYFIGLAMLQMGQHFKAFDYLVDALKNNCSGNLIHVVPFDECGDKFIMQYYLHLIKLFKQHDHYDCVIKLCDQALHITYSVQDICTLQTILLKSYLQLGYLSEAFNTLPNIPSISHRRDTMHDVVIHAFELNQFECLLDLSHKELLSDLENIALARCRALPLTDTPYYNFLYTFYMKQGHLRKAASIMYEQGVRISRELPPSVRSLQQQAFCFLSAINVLHLVDKNISWIVKPVSENKNTHSLEVKKQGVPFNDGKKQVEILTAEDISKAYHLVNAKLRLMRHKPDVYTNLASDIPARDIVIFLSKSGMYQLAMEICDLFVLPMEFVIESLSICCTEASLRLLDVDQECEDLWEWLEENEITEFGTADFSAETLAWKLLESLCMKYEKAGETVLHKTIARTLISMEQFLPHWLISSYKVKNPNELLRLLIRAGRLQEAAEFFEDYVLATLGSGKERFGLEKVLLPGKLPVYLPVHLIDVLLLELKEASFHDEEYSKIFNSVQQKLDQYLETCNRVSAEMEMQQLKSH